MTDRNDKRTKELTDSSLDALFAEAREAAPQPSGNLMARVLADAEGMIATREAEEAARIQALRPKQRHPIVAAMVAALGGWRAVAGLATAGVAGLAIGLGAPMTVTTLATGGYTDGYADGAMSYETTSYATGESGYALDDLVPSFYDLASEG
ncbi:hypothetical protein HCZ23_01790 [Celeribacter sp. HF31]|uniref:hypothetical protein n=1 Tax=Celeribacter sp. HF31 TaxID=2721558 RepID=UPI00142F8B36|nr:hypothetical protein [Celeribacter sp. HF31]NIY78203.1 hypothetical protein [Celeribacter sp. HF31]